MCRAEVDKRKIYITHQALRVLVLALPTTRLEYEGEGEEKKKKALASLSSTGCSCLLFPFIRPAASERLQLRLLVLVPRHCVSRHAEVFLVFYRARHGRKAYGGFVVKKQSKKAGKGVRRQGGKKNGVYVSDSKTMRREAVVTQMKGKGSTQFRKKKNR